MELIETIERLQSFYEKLSKAFSQYQKRTGLSCLEGCGGCCLSPEVTATVFECLPYAYHLVKEKKAEDVLERLQETQLTSCFFYQKNSSDGQKGQCTIYKHRPTLCRVFGAGGRKNKYGDVDLSVCKKIKDEFPELYQDVKNHMETYAPIPLMGVSRAQVSSLSPLNKDEDLPINKAMIKAIEYLLFRIRD